MMPRVAFSSWRGAGWVLTAPVALLLLSAGCAPRLSSFQIVDRRFGLPEARYRASFTESYYDSDGAGNVDIVLRRSEPNASDPAVTMTQVIHIHSVWRPVPGTTVAERSQINGTVSYLIMNGPIGATFEGAGSVFFDRSRQPDVLSGTLDLARLKPTRRLSGDNVLFEHAELSGEFRAVRDGRRVTRIINEMRRLLESPTRPIGAGTLGEVGRRTKPKPARANA